MIEHGCDVAMVTQLTQHTSFPCAHSQTSWHDRVVGENIDGNLTTQLSIVCEINSLFAGRPQEPQNLVPTVSEEISYLNRRSHAGETTGDAALPPVVKSSCIVSILRPDEPLIL